MTLLVNAKPYVYMVCSGCRLLCTYYMVLDGIYVLSRYSQLTKSIMSIGNLWSNPSRLSSRHEGKWLLKEFSQYTRLRYVLGFGAVAR